MERDPLATVAGTEGGTGVSARSSNPMGVSEIGSKHFGWVVSRGIYRTNLAEHSLIDFAKVPSKIIRAPSVDDALERIPGRHFVADLS